MKVFRIGLAMAMAAALGCQTPPTTRPRVLSVQTPRGLNPMPLRTTRENAVRVPTAPVGGGAAVPNAPAYPNAPAPLPQGGFVVPPAPTAGSVPSGGGMVGGYVAPPAPCPTCNKQPDTLPPPFVGG